MVLRANKHGDPLVNGKNAALQEWILILPDEAGQEYWLAGWSGWESADREP